MTSFRLRFALLAGTITAGLLLLAGYLAWNLTTRFNLDRLDRELQHLAQNNLVRVDDASHWGRLDSALAFVSGTDRPPLYVLWVKNYDRVEFRSPRWPEGIDPEQFGVAEQYEGGVTFDRPPPPPRKAGLSRNNPPLPVREARFQTVAANGSTWRVAVSGNPYTKLVLAANLDESNLALQRLRGRFLAVLPLVLVGVGVGAWWLARRALGPVTALTRAAENITAQGLDQRIAAPVYDREFQRLVTVFNAMLDRLEQSFHQARRFSADASHELKTPLALLQAELEQSLRAAPSGSPQQQLCSSLLDEIHRLKAILDKLLLLSQADSGRLALERTPADLSAILANVIDDCTALAPGLQFECVVPPGLVVLADAVLLEQALQNLLNNAVKYNRPGGLIRVVVHPEAGALLLTVGNTGPGIPPTDQPRLFERFYRGDAARTRDRAAGVGLGLSLSREILRAHGGELALGRSDGEWTEFTATLPAHASPPKG